MQGRFLNHDKFDSKPSFKGLLKLEKANCRPNSGKVYLVNDVVENRSNGELMLVFWFRWSCNRDSSDWLFDKSALIYDAPKWIDFCRQQAKISSLQILYVSLHYLNANLQDFFWNTDQGKLVLILLSMPAKGPFTKTSKNSGFCNATFLWVRATPSSTNLKVFQSVNVLLFTCVSVSFVVV